MDNLSLEFLWETLSHNMIYDISQYDIFLCSAGLQTMVVTPFFQSTVRLKGICDNGSMKGTVGGLPVIAPEQIRDCSDRPLVLLTNLRSYRELSNQLDGLHIPYMNAHAYLYHQEFSQIEAVYKQFLSDPFSKETYLSVLLGKATQTKERIYPCFTENAYFCLPQFRMASPNSVFVDCGAYTGDTLENYIRFLGNTFKAYFAFEPGERAYAAMEKRVARLMEENAIDPAQIRLEQKGCGNSDASGILMEGTSGTSNHLVFEGQGKNVEIVTLDQYFYDFSDAISYIKADVEGAELDLLKGASQIIQRDRPALAICIYHTPRDMYIIPHYIKKLVPEYQMAVRQHYYDYIETVLYCWVDR